MNLKVIIEDKGYDPMKIGIEVLKAMGYYVDFYPSQDGVPPSVYVLDKDRVIILYSTE
jgi:hypothetical protein